MNSANKILINTKNNTEQAAFSIQVNIICKLKAGMAQNTSLISTAFLIEKKSVL